MVLVAAYIDVVAAVLMVAGVVASVVSVAVAASVDVVAVVLDSVIAAAVAIAAAAVATVTVVLVVFLCMSELIGQILLFSMLFLFLNE